MKWENTPTFEFSFYNNFLQDKTFCKIFLQKSLKSSLMLNLIIQEIWFIYRHSSVKIYHTICD